MRETPLTPWHRQHHAKMMEFGGYLMPIEYGGGILAEHAAVRHAVGVFDVSHMGEFRLTGTNVASFLDYLVTNQPSGLVVGQALYTPMCYPDGGTVDDLLVYRLAEQVYMLVVNAGNIQKDWEWVLEQSQGWSGVNCENVSEDTALLAIQGPRSEALVQKLVDVDLSQLAYYHAIPARVDNTQILVSRTGYTGEDGFEVYIPQGFASHLWDKVVALGAEPVGLGARDTLRLEARLPLYDHELTPDITPLEAGLGIFVKWDKESFIGKEALARQKAEGLSRRTVGLQVEGGIARAGYPVKSAQSGEAVGSITSGTKSPTLGYPIALALIDANYARAGTPLLVQIRNREVPAVVVKTPFYKKSQPH